jgi:hypothetical protein
VDVGIPALAGAAVTTGRLAALREHVLAKARRYRMAQQAREAAPLDMGAERSVYAERLQAETRAHDALSEATDELLDVEGPPPEGPLVTRVRCRLCGAVLGCPEDSEAARARGEDPTQVLRKHLGAHPPEEILRFARRAGWVLDRLAFEPAGPEGEAQTPAQRAVWRLNLDAVVDWFLGEDLAKYPGETAVPRETAGPR